MTTNPPTVLLIASDTIGKQMAGSGIRYWNLARVLGRQQPVTLAIPAATTLTPPPGVTLVPYGAPDADEDRRGRKLAELIAEHQVIVAQHLPYLYADTDLLTSRFLVIDLYAPWILEKLEWARTDPERGEPARKDDVAILNRLLSLGDFFLCASERQRDFWLGALAAAGRIEFEHAAADPGLRTLIDIVPFGLPEAPPEKTGPGPRGTIAGIGPDDTVLLWNGGLWNWLDPLTAIRATHLLAAGDPGIRLVFMGTRSPVGWAAEMGIVTQARELARDLGLLDRHVFFNDWVPYDARQNWLLEADLTVSLHAVTAESRYSFRTRVLDNLWCGVPTVATEGDVLADLIHEEGIGLTVPPDDPGAVAEAVRQILDPARRDAVRDTIASVAQRYTWERASEPLLAFCREPRRIGKARGNDSVAAYIHNLERTYSETAQYGRHLEQVIAQQNAALERSIDVRVRRLAHGLRSRLRRR
jgi:glycosyltransferase involved in cell wall biosynthesis